MAKMRQEGQRRELWEEPAWGALGGTSLFLSVLALRRAFLPRAPPPEAAGAPDVPHLRKREPFRRPVSFPPSACQTHPRKPRLPPFSPGVWYWAERTRTALTEPETPHSFVHAPVHSLVGDRPSACLSVGVARDSLPCGHLPGTKPAPPPTEVSPGHAEAEVCKGPVLSHPCTIWGSGSTPDPTSSLMLMAQVP